MPFTSVKDLEFYYEHTDFTVPWKSEPENLLLLHGLHGSLKYWSHFQVGFFSQYFRVLNLDQRGHGKSNKPASGYSIENMAYDAYQVMRKLNFTPAHIIGASMGGMVTLQLALAFPEAVKSIVLVDSFPYSPGPLKQVIKSWIEQVKEKGYAKVMETFNKDNSGSLFSKRYLAERPNFIDYDDQSVLNNLMPAEAFIGACNAIMEFDARERLSEIKVPVLVITSNEGLGFESAQLMKDKMPNAELWTPEGVGHLINIEEPDLFNRQVLTFLQQSANK